MRSKTFLLVRKMDHDLSEGGQGFGLIKGACIRGIIISKGRIAKGGISGPKETDEFRGYLGNHRSPQHFLGVHREGAIARAPMQAEREGEKPGGHE